MVTTDMSAELEEAKEWGRYHLACRTRAAKGVAAAVHAEAELPLCPRDAFQLMAHPDNAAIFRGIERCTFRRVLWAAADAGRPDGRQTVEVENESDWHFLFFKGSIQTRMLVHEDPVAGTIHVRLAPTGGTAPLQAMTGKWSFGPGRQPGTCHVTLYQEVHPRGLPPFFHNGFRAVAGLQVRKTFEDLYAEALRMNAGRASLAPYASVARKQIAAPDCGAGLADDGGAAAGPGAGRRALPTVKEEGGEDPASVLAAAYEAESSASSSGSGSGGSALRRGPRSGSAALVAGLRSHPIGSLLDMACLAGATGASLAAEAAANAAAATAEAAAAAAKEAAGSAGWRASLYALLQRLWLASNAALGVEPDATAQLEEMAVLV